MPEAPNEAKPSSSARFNIWILVFLVGAIYAGITLYQSIYFNYKTDQQIKDLKAQMRQLDNDKEKLEALIVYYKTDTFQELEARKKLGLKMPGEKVVKVEVEKTEQQKPQSDITTPRDEKPNWQIWLDFIKGIDKS